ncbi:MAG: hypothetical protein N2491_05430 [Negativicutes bacterium]|nr:hypothetical protein [Negativicutes bacterium]
MTNEEFQKLVLEELFGIKSEISGLKSEISGLNSEVSGLKSEISGIKFEISDLNSEISGIKSEISGIKSEISGIKSEISGIKSQLSENTQIIKALMHRTEELDAKFDGLLHTTATKDALINFENKITTQLDRMAGDITFLVRKTAEHDDDIRALRRAKQGA